MKKILILGPGCPKCEKLAEQTKQAVSSLDIDCQISKVKDIQEIIKYGVVMTPALVVDGVVKISGKVPSIEEIKKLIVQ